MRKKQEYQVKVFRLERSLADRLEAYSKETGISQAHALTKAIESYLTVKGG